MRISTRTTDYNIIEPETFARKLVAQWIRLQRVSDEKDEYSFGRWFESRSRYKRFCPDELIWFSISFFSFKFIYIFIYLSMYLFTCLLIYLFINLHLYLYSYLFIYLFSYF